MTSFSGNDSNSSSSIPHPMPVYFLSIGGPNFPINTTHSTHTHMAAIGQEITTKVKPKAIVVFSAHWQASSPRKIGINVAEHADIIYDFSGFPPRYYDLKFPNRGSPAVAERVAELLGAAGMEVERVERGLDHGVWAGFMVAFDATTNPLDIPIVQVSLFHDTEDTDLHYRLGHALQGLRDEGTLIIGAGMAVHNLRDFRAARSSGKTLPTMPYTTTFDDALKEAVSTTSTNPNVNDHKNKAGSSRRQAMQTLTNRDDARQAHPTLEHILPMHIAAGAAGGDAGQRLWSFAEGSLGFGMYRFGEV